MTKPSDSEAPPPESFQDVRERVRQVVPALRQRTAQSKRQLRGDVADTFARTLFNSSGDLSSFLPEEGVPSTRR